MSTAYHSHYWAHALTLKGPSESMDNLSRSIASAKVDLNPHQVDAALFAVRSPLSRGVILADEVGLGKTIEAGIVIAQRWAERRRRILLILPATLRKQWLQEMEDKFSIPGFVMDSKEFRRREGAGSAAFDSPGQLVVCSYHFAASKAEFIQSIRWDLVVIDEAHRMRNVYKTNNKLAKAIAEAVGHSPKLLLTATPLQNSLMELYGLISVIDQHIFGDAQSFRDQFVRAASESERNNELRERLATVCTRTLRKQVQEYVRFTQRTPITQEFLPTDEEQRLYEEVSDYLQREALVALPTAQRTLMTMVMRKLLASSSFAIAATLRRLVKRLEGLLPAEEEVAEDFESYDELADEWEGNGDGLQDIDPAALQDEIRELREYAELAEGIERNAKGDALLVALEAAFRRAGELGASRKAVIFTESRKTQSYLFDLLSDAGFQDQVVCLNGTNSDPLSRQILNEWLAAHADDGRPTGSRAVDVKAALVDRFREQATILVATEAAAEGVNLQFCSLVVNYDLPWNPQRIEQRIGRCHRYGQKHDVVVVNFLNKRNAADQRVYQLLSEKFRLFDGVFGASDDVLGALESGVDLERRIADVYQQCRTEAEITAAFDALQDELNAEIESRMAETRQALLDNFDEQVQARLQVHRDQALASLTQRQQWLLSLTRYELGEAAWFDPEAPRFRYRGADNTRPRTFNLEWKAAEQRGEVFYRLDHPLAARLVERALARALPVGAVALTYSASGSKISILEALVGASGWLQVHKLSVESLETEEYLVAVAVTDDGRVLDAELAEWLLRVPARGLSGPVDERPSPTLDKGVEHATKAHLGEVEVRNMQYFDEEVVKLERWADDLKFGLERELRDLDKEIKDVRKLTRSATSLTEKLSAQKKIRAIEGRRNKKRRELYEAQDRIDGQRDELIAQIEQQLTQTHHLSTLFTFKWTLE